MTLVSLSELDDLDLSKMNLNASSTLKNLSLSYIGYSTVNNVALSFTNYTQLETVYGYNNYKANLLNLNGCTNLKSISFWGSLSSIDLTNCSSLTVADLENGNLSSIILSNCNSLTGLDLQNNNLSADALNNLFNALPLRTYKAPGEYRIIGNPGFETCTTSIAYDKYWYSVETDISVP